MILPFWHNTSELSTPCPENKGASIFLPLTLPNADRISKFYRQTYQ